MTREEAIIAYGKEIVEKLDMVIATPTGRTHEGKTELMASIEVAEGAYLDAFYFMKNEGDLLEVAYYEES